MKVLVVGVEGADFDEESTYRLAFQGKVFTAVAEPSKSPNFSGAELRVPFAVVRDGKEVLVVTVQKLVMKDGEEHFERVGQGAAPLDNPGKNPKSCEILIEKNKENSIIEGKVRVNYKLIRITMRESLRGGDAAIGVNVHGTFHNATPHDLELHLMDGESLLGTGKLPHAKSQSFLEVSKELSEKTLEIKLKNAPGEDTDIRVPVRFKGPMVGCVKRGDDDGYHALAIQHSKIVRERKYKGLITDATIIKNDDNLRSGMYLLYFEDGEIDHTPATEIEAGVLFPPLSIDSEDIEKGPGRGIYTFPRGMDTPKDSKLKEMGVLGFNAEHDEILKVSATILCVYDNPEEAAGSSSTPSATVIARGILSEKKRQDGSGGSVNYALSGFLSLGKDEPLPDNLPTEGLQVQLTLNVIDDPTFGLAKAKEEERARLEEIAKKAREAEALNEEEEDEEEKKKEEEEKAAAELAEKERLEKEAAAAELAEKERLEKEAADAKLKADEEAKLKAEADTQLKDDEEAKLKAEKDDLHERRRLAAEAEAKAEAEVARREAELEAKHKELEDRMKAEIEAKVRAEQEALEKKSLDTERADAIRADMESRFEQKIAELQEQVNTLEKEKEDKIAAELAEKERLEKEEADRIEAESKIVPVPETKKSKLLGKFKKVAQQAVVQQSVGGQIAQVMGQELKEKQKVLDDLILDNRKLTDALQISGKDQVSLREDINNMRKNIVDEKAATQKLIDEKNEAMKYVSDLSGVDIPVELSMIDRQSLLQVATTAGMRLQTMEKEQLELRAMVGDAKATRIQLGDIQHAYKDMQDAHVQQAKYIQRLQKSASQVDAYRNTIETQERVISKMQSIVEQKLRMAKLESGNGNGVGGLEGLLSDGAIGKWLGDSNGMEEDEEEKALLRDELKDAKEELDTIRNKLWEVENAANESIARTEAQAESDVTKATNEVEKLRGDLQAKEIECEAILEELAKQAHEASFEVTRLRTRLFELEIGAAINAENSADVEFDDGTGFNLAHGIEGREDMAPGVFGRDPNALKTAPLGIPGLGALSSPSSSPSKLSPGTDIPPLDFSEIRNNAAGGGVQAANALLSGSTPQNSVMLGSPKLGKKIMGAARRASVMMSVLGGGGVGSEQVEKIAMAMAASEAFDGGEKKKKKKRDKSPRDKDGKRIKKSRSSPRDSSGDDDSPRRSGSKSRRKSSTSSPPDTPTSGRKSPPETPTALSSVREE